MEIAPFVLLGLVIIFQLLDIFFPNMNQKIKLSLEGTQAWGVFLFSFLLIKQSLGLRTGYILGFPFNSILPKRVIYDIPPILFFVSCFAGGLWIGSKTKLGYFRPISLSVLLVIIFTIIARALNLSASYAIFFEEVFTELKTSLPISVWSTFLYMPLALLGFIGGSFFIKMKRKIASIFKRVTARSAH